MTTQTQAPRDPAGGGGAPDISITITPGRAAVGLGTFVRALVFPSDPVSAAPTLIERTITTAVDMPAAIKAEVGHMLDMIHGTGPTAAAREELSQAVMQALIDLQEASVRLATTTVMLPAAAAVEWRSSMLADARSTALATIEALIVPQGAPR